MKIVCFPHYTCGGLLCDILNHTWSARDHNGGIGSLHHSIGKIGDSSTVYRDFDQAQLIKKLRESGTADWVGTHCWLGRLDTSLYDQVINITTMTYRSRLYRWIRAYHHYYLDSQPWRELQGMDMIDKQRETAKNYLSSFEPMHNEKTTNIEFADVVDCRPAFLRMVSGDVEKHIARWQQINSFLYDPGIWRSAAADRFYEAEFEITINRRYIYE